MVTYPTLPLLIQNLNNKINSVVKAIQNEVLLPINGNNVHLIIYTIRLKIILFQKRLKL